MKNLCKFVDTKNLEHNALLLKKQLKNQKICAVLKSNAYGHGLKMVAKTLSNFVNFFAVLNKDEAKQILKLKKPILMLQKQSKIDFEFACKNGVFSSIFCDEDVLNAKKASLKTQKNCNLHIKINSGMNRMGISTLTDFLRIQNQIKKCKLLKLKGIFTHCGSGKGKRTDKQLENFDKILIHSKKNILSHYANTSISSFCVPKQNQMARIGIAFFGYGPFKNLKPVLSVFAKVVNVLNVSKGEFVGYGNKHKTKENKTLAVLAIGYANGLMRCYSKKGFVLLHGKKAKIVADICMNMTIVDVSQIPKTKVGDYATILGENENQKITATDIAKKCNTIPYEILTNFSAIPLTKTKPKT